LPKNELRYRFSPFWCQQQVRVIGHQYLGVQRAFGLAQPMQVAVVIVLGKETRLAVVSTLHDVELNAIEGAGAGAA
jgi:hypothetical protein